MVARLKASGAIARSRQPTNSGSISRVSRSEVNPSAEMSPPTTANRRDTLRNGRPPPQMQPVLPQEIAEHSVWSGAKLSWHVFLVQVFQKRAFAGGAFRLAGPNKLLKSPLHNLERADFRSTSAIFASAWLRTSAHVLPGVRRSARSCLISFSVKPNA